MGIIVCAKYTTRHWIWRPRSGMSAKSFRGVVFKSSHPALSSFNLAFHASASTRQSKPNFSALLRYFRWDDVAVRYIDRTEPPDDSRSRGRHVIESLRKQNRIVGPKDAARRHWTQPGTEEACVQHVCRDELEEWAHERLLRFLLGPPSAREWWRSDWA